MMHLLFLLGGFAATFLLQMALLLRLSFQTRWKDKRSLALVALSLPGLTLLLFSLLMVPDILMVHGSLQYHWEQSLLWAGVVLPVLLCGLAFVWGLLRLLWLVIRVQRCTWPAPAHLSGGDYPAHVSVRLWYH